MDILHRRQEQNYAFSDFTVKCPFKSAKEKKNGAKCIFKSTFHTLFVWSKFMSEQLCFWSFAGPRLSFSLGIGPHHSTSWWESTLTRLPWPHISTCVHKVSNMSTFPTSLDSSVKPLRQSWKSCFGKHSSRNHPDQNVARRLLPELICG